MSSPTIERLVGCCCCDPSVANCSACSANASGNTVVPKAWLLESSGWTGGTNCTQYNTGAATPVILQKTQASGSGSATLGWTTTKYAIVFVMTNDPGDPALPVSESSWLFLGSIPIGSTALGTLTVYGRDNNHCGGSSGPDTFTTTSGATLVSVQGEEWSGVAAAEFLKSNTGSGSPSTTGSLTTSNANELFLAGFLVNGTLGATGGGFNADLTDTLGVLDCGVASQVANAGTYSATWGVIGGTTAWANIILSLRSGTPLALLNDSACHWHFQNIAGTNPDWTVGLTLTATTITVQFHNNRVSLFKNCTFGKTLTIQCNQPYSFTGADITDDCNCITGMVVTVTPICFSQPCPPAPGPSCGPCSAIALNWELDPVPVTISASAYSGADCPAGNTYLNNCSAGNVPDANFPFGCVDNLDRSQHTRDACDVLYNHGSINLSLVNGLPGATSCNQLMFCTLNVSSFPGYRCDVCQGCLYACACIGAFFGAGISSCAIAEMFYDQTDNTWKFITPGRCFTLLGPGDLCTPNNSQNPLLPGWLTTYSIPAASFNCLGPNTFTLVTAGKPCTGWPATITIRPAP